MEQLNGVFYCLNCIGDICKYPNLPDNFFPASEVKNDKEAIQHAINYEAELVKYEYKDGVQISAKTLHTPQF